MKRSEINETYRAACDAFAEGGWALPPEPRWDITDFGLGNFREAGLTLINLAEEKEYCEKLMFAWKNQVTPMHTHKQKKEDIICRKGRLELELWGGRPDTSQKGETFPLQRNGTFVDFPNGETLVLEAGERVTLTPGIWHAFWPGSDYALIGEVSTANDDANDNFFVNPDIGRFPGIEEDVPAEVRLITEPAN